MIHLPPQHPTDRPVQFDAGQLDAELTQAAANCIAQGQAPPREIYNVQNRRRIDWGRLPLWARPCDPDLFDGCCHEG